MILNRNRHTGVIIRAAQIVDKHTLRYICSRYTPIGEQTRYIEDFDFLILGSVLRLFDFLVVVELGVSDLMHHRRNSLDFAHTLTDGDALIVQREKAVCIVCNRLKINGYRRRSPECFHEDFVILNITGQIGRKLRQRLTVCLRNIEHRNRLEHGDFDFLFLHDNFAVRIKHGQLGVRVQLLFFNLLLEGCGGNDLDAFFTFEHIALELVAPFVEASHQSSVGLLHINQHLVIDAVTMKPAHCPEILSVLV